MCACLPGEMSGQISQIPGLSPVIPPEEKTQRQRGIVKESDSEYIKLAKRGGHKGRVSVHTIHPSQSPLSESLISARPRSDGCQGSCGTRTSPPGKSLRTNLLIGSYLHQSTTARGIFVLVFGFVHTTTCKFSFKNAVADTLNWWMTQC